MCLESNLLISLIQSTYSKSNSSKKYMCLVTQTLGDNV